MMDTSFKLFLLYYIAFWTFCAGLSTDLRLRGSAYDKKIKGHLEVRFGRVWGTVCDDNFDSQAADVACRQLGFQAAEWYLNAGHPWVQLIPIAPGKSTIWLDEVACKGNETSLKQCKSREPGRHNCIHYEDVTLECKPKERLRPLNDEDNTVVRIEVRVDGQWGSICSNNFSNAEAYVACVEMGFVTGEVRYSEAHAETYWLDKVSCEGNKPSLFHCDRSEYKKHRCEKAAVIKCYNGDPKKYNVKLSGGLDKFAGLLEVQYLGVWGTVCHHSFDNNAASVACRDMGFQTGRFLTIVGKYKDPMHKDKNDKIWLDYINCDGTEDKLEECNKGYWGIHNCEHWQDVVIECFNGTQIKYNLRLQDGVNEQYGRLEIKYAGLTFFFCGWRMNYDAYTVACHDMGMEHGYDNNEPHFYYRKLVGHELGYTTPVRMWPRQIVCTGDESKLLDCFQNEDFQEENYKCIFGRNARLLYCKIEKNYEMRLTETISGQLQVKHNDQWNNVCFGDDDPSGQLAHMICRAISFIQIDFDMTYLGPCINLEPRWPYTFTCYGKETSLKECQVSDAINYTNYGNYHITCSDHTYEGLLVRGAKPSSGTLLVYRKMHNSDTIDELYMICNETFARHLHLSLGCMYFGYEYGRYLRPKEVNSDLLLKYDAVDVVGGIMSCKERLISIFQCYPKLTFGDCALSGGIMYDLRLQCYNEDEYDFRIVGGPDEQTGRVELFRNGQWGYVCLEEWNDPSIAMLACNEMGFTHGALLNANLVVPCVKVEKIWLDNVSCIGNETRLDQCQHGQWGKHSCDDCNVLQVECWNHLRLWLEGFIWPHGSVGFVEIEYQGVWGTICNDMFDNDAAMVTCRELGFHMGKVYKDFHNTDCVERHNKSSVPIWLSHVNCVGTEESLGSCQTRVWGNNTCSHMEDVFVQCWFDNADEFRVRLTDGEKSNSGFLEVFYDGEWGTVCETGFKDNRLAVDVACREIGFTSGIYQTNRRNTNTASNVTGQTIWLRDVECTGREESLLQCRRNAWGIHECNHGDDVYIKCFDDDYKLRMRGGIDSMSGRLEIKYHGRWGRVCRRPLHIVDKSAEIHVACRQMGFLSGADSQKTLNDINGEYYGMQYDEYIHNQRNVPIWVEYLECNGNEPSLSECNIHIGEQKGYCQYLLGMQDLFIQCWLAELRLTGGNNSSVGRLEVKYGEEWGTVCDDLFEHNDNAAIVACVEMGFVSGKHVSSVHSMLNMSVTSQTKPIWLDDVVCTGLETKLSDCRHFGWGRHNCDHSEDVIIVCID